MKRFNFRLEKILRYKNQVEERKKQILSERNNELNMEMASLSALKVRNASYRIKYSSLFRGKMNILRLRLSRDYLDKLNRDIIKQTGRVRESEQRVDKAKRQLQKAMRDRKKYEKLKERRKSEYDYEYNRQEQKDLDEIGSRQKFRMTSTGTAP